MKIVLFSSHYPGAVNKLNIYRLIAANPNYEFTYVLVDNRFKYLKNKFKNLLKEIILFFLLKKTDWFRVRRLIDKKISAQVPAVFDSHIKKSYVKDVNSTATEIIIRDLEPDLLIQCGAGILKENIYSIPKMGSLNVHHGIAPELRGVSSTFWAMYYGLHDYIGATVHFVDKTLDTGAVIIQRQTSLPKSFDYFEASFQTAMQGSILLPEAIKIIQEDYSITEKEVKSYYFSSVHYKKYWELKKNNFQRIENYKDLKNKIKCKKLLLPTSHLQ